MSCNFLSHLLYLALLKTYFANYFIFFEGGTETLVSKIQKLTGLK